MAKVVTTTDGSVWYWCPGCKRNHRIMIAGPIQWDWDRNVDAPTFSPSILVSGYPEEKSQCHHFVRAGKIEYLPDCTHAQAGQTIAMEDFDGNLRGVC